MVNTTTEELDMIRVASWCLPGFNKTSHDYLELISSISEKNTGAWMLSAHAVLIYCQWKSGSIA
jgi:hypothetical protein